MSFSASKKILLVLMLFLYQNSFSQVKNYNVKDHIINTGKTVLITSELQSLINKCSASGGGTIYFPAGDYLTGTIILKDNTFLDLEAGATIFGSMDMKD